MSYSFVALARTASMTGIRWPPKWSLSFVAIHLAKSMAAASSMVRSLRDEVTQFLFRKGQVGCWSIVTEHFACDKLIRGSESAEVTCTSHCEEADHGILARLRHRL